MINFYQDVFKRKSHILTPLNDLAAATAKKKKGEKKKKKRNSKFQILKVHLDTYKQAKKMITTKVKLAFLDYSKPFHLYTDANDTQLGATLVQDWKSIRFYTRTLNDLQVNYTSGEKGFLGIVVGLKAIFGVIQG